MKASEADVKDRRITLRLLPDEARLLEAAAAGAGVSVGGLVREAALRAYVDTAREIAAGRLAMRRANGMGPAPRGKDAQAKAAVPPQSENLDRAEAFRRATQPTRATSLRGG